MKVNEERPLRVVEVPADPGDAVDEAIEAVEQEEERKIVRMKLGLTGGRSIEIVVPHPFTPDDFESAIVGLLNMRAASEARAEAERPILTPAPTVLVGANGKPVASIKRSDA